MRVNGNLLITVATCALLGACSGNDNGKACSNACEEAGGSQCAGDSVQSCELADSGCLEWTDTTDCAASGESCDMSGTAASCSVGCVDACSSGGASQCVNTVIQRCQLDASGCLDWVNESDCDNVGGTCELTGEISGAHAVCNQPCSNNCPATGDTRCAVNSTQRCSIGVSGCLEWADVTDCETNGELCDASSGTATCVVSCTDTCPGDGNTRCVDSVTQACADGGNGCLSWQDSSDCATAGNVCADSNGTATCVCVPACESDSECDDSNVSTDNICAAPGTCAAACSNPPFDCVANADCDDGNPCTINSCNAGNTCDEVTACPGGECSGSLVFCADESGYLHPHTEAVLTNQVTSVDGTTADLWLTTYSIFPYFSNIQSIELPNINMSVISSTEDEGSRDCPNSNGVCKQTWKVLLDVSHPDVCQLDGTYTWNFTYSCAPGGDCSLMDPGETTHLINTVSNSENFCSETGVECSGNAIFCPDENGYLHPHTEAVLTNQVTAVDGTTADLWLTTYSVFPYFSNMQSLGLPNVNMSVISITEDGAFRDCPNSDSVCKQVWKAVLDVSHPDVCSLNGTYTWNFNYSCAPGGDCSLMDPGDTTYLINTVSSSENFCP